MTEDEKRIAWIILEQDYPEGKIFICPRCGNPAAIEQLERTEISTEGLDMLAGLLLNGYVCPACKGFILGKVSNR